MPLPRFSLQVLEAFEHVARLGSMQAAAQELGMSVSTVSHHVARLEAQLGAVLIDRSSRPFSLTREGREALHHLSQGLQHLRRATSETAIGGFLGARSLRIGIVDDLESNVAPDLAVVLAGRMPRARLSITTIPSHEAPDLLRKGLLDLAVASETADRAQGILADPIVSDPFVLAAPSDVSGDPATLMASGDSLPFLRFNAEHLIGRQIEAHLARNRVSLPNRFAFDSVQSILAVIANGDGWSMITPLGYVRARRYAGRVRLHPLPIPAFARRVSLMSVEAFERPIARAIAGLLRDSVQRAAVVPVRAEYPWLSGAFSIHEPTG
ncbi:MAG: LysR family transcriptional regulator [Pseudomonadota bacterium]